MHSPLAAVIGGLALSATTYAIALAGLLGWVTVYLVYKVAWRPDFGLPVRRRLLSRGLRVENDQIAFVPFWWSDVQVQRAIKTHWRQSLRQGLSRTRTEAGV